jgi:hypothetical protein
VSTVKVSRLKKQKELIAFAINTENRFKDIDRFLALLKDLS